MTDAMLPLFDSPAPGARRDRHRKGPDSLDALPPSLNLMAAAALLGIGRTCAYGLVRRGEWPTPVIRVGRCIRIPTAPLVELLRSSRGGFPQTAAASAAGRSRG
jgi:hypothetical protein